MHLEQIAEIDGLEAIAEQWSALPLPSPMQSPAWLIPWWQVYGGGGRELSVIAIRDDNARLVGLCPWYVEPRSTGSCLRWLGDGAVCSDHAAILAARHAHGAVLHAVCDWLHSCPANRCNRMALEAVDDDDAMSAAFMAHMRRRGWLIGARLKPGTSCIDLPSSWEEYLSQVSKNHRKRCRKWQRDFFDSGRARLRIATDPDECLQLFDFLVKLHNQRRQAAGTPGAFEDRRFRAFHRLAIRRLATHGKLQLRLLSVDHQLVAVEQVLLDSRAYYAYQSGMSAAGAALSAGNLSILALIREAIDRGRRRLDLLRGDEAYKFSWGATIRPAPTRILRRRSVAGLVQSCFDHAVQRTRLLLNPTT